jgi:hypothetical protein
MSAQNEASSVNVVEAVQSGKTQRSAIRWDAIRHVAYWASSAASAGFVAWALAGRTTVVDANVVIAASATVMGAAIPAGLAKIGWDRQQKRRQREVIQSLEAQNTSLRRQVESVKELSTGSTGEMPSGAER